MAGVTDNELVRRAASGDGKAWVGLVDRHLPALVSFAWYKLGSHAEAEDVAQETMLRLSKKAQTWQPDGASLRTWLYRVASNLCIDRQRMRQIDSLDDVSEDMVIELKPNNDRAIDISRLVRRALTALPERQQTVLILVYYEGFRIKEAAEVMGISEHATESLIARARRSMRKALEPEKAELLGARG